MPEQTDLKALFKDEIALERFKVYLLKKAVSLLTDSETDAADAVKQVVDELS